MPICLSGPSTRVRVPGLVRLTRQTDVLVLEVILRRDWAFMKKSTRLFVVGLGICVSTVVGSASARAFDTGHHSDLTRSALQEEGFGETAIQVGQMENWLVDC